MLYQPPLQRPEWCLCGRYGFVERVRQGREFVAALLDRVVGLLLKSLQKQWAGCRTQRQSMQPTYFRAARYGYVERVRQGREFVAALLDRVIGLLLKSLQEQLAHSAALRADLGLRDIFPVPVRACAALLVEAPP